MHNSRSAVTRPAGSQASYGVFASTLDFGLIPFYVFTAYMAYGEWTTNAYNWGTLFNNSDITAKLSETTFILALANGTLHLLSLGISIFLATTFRKISHLPPDMNPLEDNLTARPRKNRKEAGMEEKHLSQSTLNSSLEDTLIGSPRSVPFSHTREQPFATDSYGGPMDMMDEQRQSYPPTPHHRLSHFESPTDLSNPEELFHHPASQPFDLTSKSPTPTPEYRNVASHAPEIINATAQMRHLSPRTAERSDTVSPLSDNWIAYSERSISPDAQNMNETTLRQSSSVYSRKTDKTTTSTGSAIRDWFAYGPKATPNVGSAIPEDVRGEYASLTMQEYYGIDDNAYGQDVGDQRMDIFPDPEEHNDDLMEDRDDSLPFNPLMLNPPTPQPILTQKPENTDPVRRVALSDQPNMSYNENSQPVSIPHESSTPSSPPTRFYGELDVDDKPGLGLEREPSVQLARKPTKLTKKQNKKMSAYAALKKNDSGDEAEDSSPEIPTSPRAIDSDRKGRVVSNTGTDTARFGIAAGVGASLSSYGSYIAGLGVGRRRDVSGKVAEEGRSAPAVSQPPASQTPGSSPVRAAGWARFAGL